MCRKRKPKRSRVRLRMIQSTHPHKKPLCLFPSLFFIFRSAFQMKYLEVPPLSSLCAKINQNTESGIRLNCRIEVYSCDSKLDIAHI